MLNTYMDTSADTNETRIEKSLRRKLAEVVLYLWGVAGMGISFLLIFRIVETPFHSAIPAVIMYILTWIGGLLFLGFWALLAPVKVTHVVIQTRMTGNGERFEHEGNQSTVAVPNVRKAA
jgi:hypothetical protein